MMSTKKNIPFLVIKNLTKFYSDRHANGSKRLALIDIDLQVWQNENLAIVGQTGSGKSTLLQVVAGLLAPDTGEIFFDGEPLEDPAEQLIPGHTDIAYLSQHFELPKYITVERHLFDPYEMTVEEAEKVYRACQIEHLLKADTGHLSGGEKQRVALAKLILRHPRLLLLDEPFSNLDPIHKQTIKEVIQSVSHDLDLTVALVSHDPADVLAWAERIVVLKEGKILQTDDPQTTYRHPADEYVAGLFGRYNLINPEEWGLKPNGHLKASDGRIVVRPEAFTLSSNGKTGVDGAVKKIFFLGGHQEMQVETDKNWLTVRSAVGAYTKDQPVKVHLKKH